MQAKSLMFMCNFDDPIRDQDNEVIRRLWNDKWPIDNKNICKRLLSTKLEVEALNAEIKSMRDDQESLEEVLYLAISAFLTFCEHNWNSRPEKLDIQEYFNGDWPEDMDVTVKMQRDSEPLYVNIEHPELLYFAEQVLNALCAVDVEQNLVHLWWSFRCKIVHQRALEDTSATIYSELELLIAKLYNELQGLNEPRVQAVLCVEIAQGYLLYGRVQPAEEYLVRARELVGLKLELTGVLGKRTKFQQSLLPQLALSSTLDTAIPRPSAVESHGNTELPPEIELDDDVRLNKIEYTEKISQAELPSLEQTLCLVTVQYIQKSHAKDDLTNEEIQPYIAAVLSQKSGAWATRVAAMLVRCKLEAGHKRTVERAMLQCEAIVNDKSNATATARLSYMFASGLPPAWSWRQELADLYLSLGLVKAALEVYHQLQLWEDVIVCYTLLQLRHKAAEVIQQQIDANPTVKLYCLLGDATDDVKCYEKAWEFSKHKSSRAQRHWGNYFFERKKYEECMPHYEKSVDINSIQEGVWLRLGYAGLLTGQWAGAARAYRRYTYLQPHSFEAWNNLAKVYINLGDKGRAYRALLEALRFNYDNWKLWENVVTVSIDTGHFEDVIRGVHRLLDLRHQFDDLQLLELLVQAVLTDIQDADGNGARRLQKRVLELFGRITSIHQNNVEIWKMYADLSPTNLLRAQRLLKAYRGYTQNGNWPNNPDTCKKVIELTHSLLEYSLKARQESDEKDVLQANSQLSSARLTGQAVFRMAENKNWPELQPNVEELKELFNIVTEYMKSIV